MSVVSVTGGVRAGTRGAGETDGKGKGKGEDGFETGTGTETDGFILSQRCFLAVAIAHAIARVRGRARIAAAVESRGGVR